MKKVCYIISIFVTYLCFCNGERNCALFQAAPINLAFTFFPSEPRYYFATIYIVLDSYPKKNAPTRLKELNFLILQDIFKFRGRCPKRSKSEDLGKVL